MTEKMKKLFYLFSLLALVSFSSCENGDWSFPDYGTTTVYFAYQYPVRTIFWVMMKFLIIHLIININV